MNAEISKKLCVLAHVSSKFDSSRLISHFRDDLVGHKKAPLGQKKVQEVKNCVLEQFPANYAQKVSFHLNDLIVSI